MPALVFPTVSVQVAFANNALTPLASLTWTDITNYVGKIDMRRGRQHELGRVEVGSLSMELVNFDDRFSPWNTASPYYGPFTDGADTGVLGLVPMKRLRIRATWAGTTYNLWHGFVDAWPSQWPSEKEAYVEVTASDAFKLLNLKKITSSFYRQQIINNATSGWWRLGDPPGTLSAANAGTVGGGPFPAGYCHAGTSGYPTFGVAGALFCDSDTACDFGPYDATGAGPYIDITGGGMGVGAPSAPGSVEFWLKMSSAPPIALSVLGQGTAGGANSFDIYLDTAGRPNFRIVDSAPLVHLVTGPVSVCDGNWHLLTMTGIPNLIGYVDGTSVGTSTIGSAVNMTAGQPTIIGGAYNGATVWAGGGFQFDEVNFYAYGTWPAAAIAAHYQLRLGFLQQRTDQRVADLLTAIGWPTADRSLETGVSTVAAPASTLATTAVLQHLYDVVDTENGLCFMNGAGQVQFNNRNHLIKNATSATSQVTLGEGAEPYDLAGTVIGEDDLDIWNEVDVTRVGGVLQASTDATSTTRYGPRILARTNVLNTTDGESSAAAQYLLARYKDPLPRVQSVVIHPLGDPANLFPQVLGRELADQVTVTRRAVGGGVAFSQPCNIEQIDHAIDPVGDWHTTWHLSAHDAKAYLVLDDANLGKLDTSRLYY